jgi:heptosyltransferase-1
MGDVVFALSIIQDFRLRFPKARIDWIVDEDFSAIVRSHSAIQQIISLPLRRLSRSKGARTRLSVLLQLARSLQLVRKLEYDVLLDMQGVIKSGCVTTLVKSRKKWTFTSPHLESRLFSFAYTDFWEPEREKPSVFQHRIFAGYALGYSPVLSNTSFMFPPMHRIVRGADRALSTVYKNALLVPFSSKASKQLSIETMGEIASLLRVAGYTLFMVVGSAQEQVEAAKIVAFSGCKLEIIYRPLENFDNFYCRLSGLSLCVGVDTGIIHLAAAMGVTTIGIFLTSDSNIYGPHIWAADARSLDGSDPLLITKIRDFLPLLSKNSTG